MSVLSNPPRPQLPQDRITRLWDDTWSTFCQMLKTWVCAFLLCQLVSIFFWGGFAHLFGANGPQEAFEIGLTQFHAMNLGSQRAAKDLLGLSTKSDFKIASPKEPTSSKPLPARETKQFDPQSSFSREGVPEVDPSSVPNSSFGQAPS